MPLRTSQHSPAVEAHCRGVQSQLEPVAVRYEATAQWLWRPDGKPGRRRCSLQAEVGFDFLPRDEVIFGPSKLKFVTIERVLSRAALDPADVGHELAAAVTVPFLLRARATEWRPARLTATTLQ